MKPKAFLRKLEYGNLVRLAVLVVLTAVGMDVQTTSAQNKISPTKPKAALSGKRSSAAFSTAEIKKPQYEVRYGRWEREGARWKREVKIYPNIPPALLSPGEKVSAQVVNSTWRNSGASWVSPSFGISDDNGAFVTTQYWKLGPGASLALDDYEVKAIVRGEQG